jgi:competence protein ComEC
MTKQIKKLIKYLLPIVVVILIVNNQLAIYFNTNLHEYFLNVGQGDACYIQLPNRTDILIDGGPDSKVVSELGSVMPFWDKKIDYLIITHPHADHISGLIDVIKRYDIGQILGTNAVNSSGEYLELIKLIKSKNIPFRLVEQGDIFQLSDSIRLDILWPNQSFFSDNVSNLNNTSVVAKLTYNNFSTLFTGDAEEDIQNLLVSSISDQLKADVLKVPHHGSSNAASEQFIKKVSPNIAVISVGLKNMFGHPAKITLDKYLFIGSTIYRTDRNGRVEVISDGQKFWVKTAK